MRSHYITKRPFSDLKFDEKDCEVTDELCHTVLSLPMHPYMRN